MSTYRIYYHNPSYNGIDAFSGNQITVTSEGVQLMYKSALLPFKVGIWLAASGIICLFALLPLSSLYYMLLTREPSTLPFSPYYGLFGMGMGTDGIY